MSLFVCREIVKRYGAVSVLEGASFDLKPGERVALVGPNGAGKSTLMRILVGELDPDAGEVATSKSVRVGYLDQHPTFDPGRTVWEEARSAFAEAMSLSDEAERLATAMAEATDDDERDALGRRFDRVQEQLLRDDAYEVDHRIESVLTGLGFGPDAFPQEAARLSGGQQSRLILARLLLEAPDVLLLDEPSNHLDIAATNWLENHLLTCGRTILLVSHDRYLLDRVATRTLELVDGTLDSYPGNYSKYKLLKAERLEVQRRTYEKQQTEIAKIQDFIRRNGSGQKSAQAKDREKKLDRIEAVERPREIAAPAMSFPPPDRTGDIVLRVEGLAKSFDKPLFKNVGFQVERGQKWGLLGPNGVGKTTLLKVILGKLTADAGTVKLGANVRIGYFDQHLHCLADDAIVMDAIRPPHKEFVEQQRRDHLARFGLTGEMAFQKVSSLSGGERNRTALAQLAALDANVLVLDEPTNHLDLWARDALEKALREFDGTLLFVSHDRYFINQVADHLLIVEPERVRAIEGNYDTFRLLEEASVAEAARPSGRTGASKAGPAGAVKGGSATSTTANGSERGPRAKPERPKRRFPYRKVADLEQDIERTETTRATAIAQMSDPDVVRDGERMRALAGQLETLDGALARLYEHLEEAIEFN